MYVHKGAHVAYLAHMKVASRATRDVLLGRGFEQVFGHHGGPHFCRKVGCRGLQRERQEYWFAQDPGDWTFYATVRNHLDIFSTFATWKGIEDVNEASIRGFMWQHQPHFHNAGRLFRFWQEVPDVKLMRYECLRDDLDRMLRRTFGDAYGLQPGELEWRENYRTKGKPADVMDALGAVGVRAVKAIFAAEMAELGYVRKPLDVPVSDDYLW